jgi:hypothetical protein
MLAPGCSGKHRYANAEQAWRVIRRDKAWRGRRIVRMLSVYRFRGVVNKA